MKLSVITLTLVGLASQLSVTNTFAAQLEAVQGNPVEVVRAYLEVSGDSDANTRIDIYAVAQFSNDCMAPETLVTTSDQPFGEVGGTLNLQLSGINSTDRFCTAEFRPVRKTVLVRTLYTDIMPAKILVNGKVASQRFFIK
jgi:hypothetical protein